jgi:hypothetical protein
MATAVVDGGGANPEGDFTFTVENGEATITKYTGTSRSVVIPDTLGGAPVTTIGLRAFDTGDITSVVLPSTLKTIGYRAFSWRSSLTSIEIPYGVTEIEEDAFFRTGISNVVLPESLVSIGQGAFNTEVALTVHIPASLERVIALADGTAPFTPFTGVTAVTFAEGRTQIPDNLFYRAANLTSITLPDTVTHIGNGAFRESGLTNITIPDSVTHIGDGAFHHSRLTSIEIPEGVTAIGVSAFGHHHQGEVRISSVTLPDSLVSIGRDAFRTVEEVHFVSMVEQVDPTFVIERGSPFSSNLTTVTFGEGITRIPTNLFNGCSGLVSMTLPDTVTEIGVTAFRGA